MKKVIKAICCILAAVILVGGGYVAGQRAKQSSIVSALPKIFSICRKRAMSLQKVLNLRVSRRKMCLNRKRM